MRKPFVAANWKLHGSESMATSLVAGIVDHIAGHCDCDVVICPPFTLAQPVRQTMQGSILQLGAQNVSDQRSGAYTGEISAQMLAEVGFQWVIIGHSERRHIYHESDDMMAAKFSSALEAGLKPILCVGETLQQREADDTETVVLGQLNAVLSKVGISAFEDAVIAYEPVWAIGTGKTATTAQAQQVHAVLRSELVKHSQSVAGAARIVYGGSVKPDNAADLFAQVDIDGGLIGGASLDAAQFSAIVNAAPQAN